jgi:hypothetical protein
VPRTRSDKRGDVDGAATASIDKVTLDGARSGGKRMSWSAPRPQPLGEIQPRFRDAPCCENACMKVPASKTTERIGLSAVAQKFERDFGWSFREQPINDTGVDAQVEVVQQGVSTGRLLALQVKSGESYFRERSGQGFVFRGKPGHLGYWLAHSLPVILVLYDPVADVAYWQSITADTIERTSKGWKVSVPLKQTLSSPSIPALSELAHGDPYELVLRRFQLERPWMETTLSGGRLLLEVDEWVNKSSGRGDFRLKAEDASGKEVLVRDWPIVLFPGMDYEDVLPTLFPWADLSIDEIVYEQHDEDQFLTETGIWDSEDGRYIEGLLWGTKLSFLRVPSAPPRAFLWSSPEGPEGTERYARGGDPGRSPDEI